MRLQARGYIISDDDVLDEHEAQPDKNLLTPSNTTLEVEVYSTFTPFPRLPFELRTSIWRWSIKPQVIFIHRDSDFEADHRGQPRCKVNTIVPASLHTCHESRTFVSKIYQPSFGRQLKGPIYFNHETDYLCFADVHASKSFHNATRYSQRLLKLDDPDVMQGPEEAINIFLACKAEVADQHIELLQEALANTTHIFPRAKRIIVIGHESQVPLWIEIELLVDLLRTRPDDPRIHSLIMGWCQMINGELVRSPKWEPPTIEFWSERNWQDWVDRVRWDGVDIMS